MTSTRRKVDGLEDFGEVDIRKITERRSGSRLGPRDPRLVGIVTVPRDYPGSSNVGCPENVSIMGAVSYDGGETWELL